MASNPRDSHNVLIRGITPSIQTQPSSIEGNSRVVPPRDDPLLTGKRSAQRVVIVTFTQSDDGTGRDGSSRGRVVAYSKTVGTLLDGLDGQSVDRTGGEGSEGGEEDDGGDHFGEVVGWVEVVVMV
jgi:hypothetical protein